MQKTAVNFEAVDEPLTQGFMQDAVFNLGGLRAVFNANTEDLILRLPAVALDFDEFANQARKLGLENWEIEPLLDDFAREIRTRVFAKILASRMR